MLIINGFVQVFSRTLIRKFIETIPDMAEQQLIKERLASLEERIQKFISLHEELKASNQALQAENRRLLLVLEEERVKASRIEEGYKNLKTQEIQANRHQVDRINIRINELINEIDKNIKLMDA